MCGRYTLRQTSTELAEFFELFHEPAWTPRYNIAPTQSVLTIRATQENNGLEAVPMRWGLIPSWAKDLKIGSSLINARAETIAEKPAFRTAFRRRRCLVLADGFYEWLTLSPKQKQPHYFQLKTNQPFAFAGLWETWQPPTGPPIQSCTIITTAANALVQPLHDRMPVIIPAPLYTHWLQPNLQDPQELLPLLTPYPSEQMQQTPVSTLVNSVRNDRPELVQDIDIVS